MGKKLLYRFLNLPDKISDDFKTESKENGLPD
jgi:hypothetical protein